MCNGEKKWGKEESGIEQDIAPGLREADRRVEDQVQGGEADSVPCAGGVS